MRSRSAAWPTRGGLEDSPRAGLVHRRSTTTVAVECSVATDALRNARVEVLALGSARRPCPVHHLLTEGTRERDGCGGNVQATAAFARVLGSGAHATQQCD